MIINFTEIELRRKRRKLCFHHQHHQGMSKELLMLKELSSRVGICEELSMTMLKELSSWVKTPRESLTVLLVFRQKIFGTKTASLFKTNLKSSKNYQEFQCLKANVQSKPHLVSQERTVHNFLRHGVLWLLNWWRKGLCPPQISDLLTSFIHFPVIWSYPRESTISQKKR